MLFFKNKINKLVFRKLYRYYLIKSLSVVIWLPFIILVFFFQGRSLKNHLLKNIQPNNWKELLGIFGIISFIQLVFMYMIISQIVMKLVGRESSFSNWRVVFRDNKIEDIKVFTLTPTVSREAMIVAKFATAATYFLVINLLVITLPLFFYLWRVVGLSLLTSLGFLGLNGLVLGLANFVLLAPFLFYLWENYSVKTMFISFLITFLIGLPITIFYKSIFSYLFLIPFLALFLSIIIGSTFFYLYWRDYLRKDLI